MAESVNQEQGEEKQSEIAILKFKSAIMKVGGVIYLRYVEEVPNLIPAEADEDITNDYA